MSNHLPRIIVSVVFFGSLVGVEIANQKYAARPIGTPVQIADAIKRYGFHLDEIGKAAGIDFVHHAPVLDAKLGPIMPEVASMGAAVSICDFDHDGLPDVYVCDSTIGGQNHLYRNLGDGKFDDVAAQVGLADVNKDGTGVSMGAVWGDYDNDGLDDVLIYKWSGHPLLLHNNGGKSFTDVSAETGIPQGVINVNSATFVDYDCDGHLDLFIAGYFPDNLDLWHLKDTLMMPNSFEYASNGGRKFLLHNDGSGKFADVTQQMGIDSHRWTLAVGAADLRGTGYPDLVLANDYGVTEVYANNQGKSFTEIGKKVGIGYHPKSGMNCSFGDIMNDGRLSIYVSNISAEGQLTQGNNLWVPKPGTSGDSLAFDNMAQSSGVDYGGWSFGGQFGDLNNDGSQDLVLTNGYISGNPKARSYWYDFGKIATGFGPLINDAKNWPAIHDMSLSGYEQKRVWINDGYGTFRDVAQAVGYNDTHDGRSVALGDLWNTGALDMLVANQKGPLLVYRNTPDPTNQWLELELTGTKSNRDAIGAQVTLYWKDSKGLEFKQLQQVQCASGFCAQNDHRLHFGIGKGSTVEKAEIRWPLAGSQVQTVQNLQVGKVNEVKE